MIVPHHGIGHPGQHARHLGAAPLLAVELAIEAVELLLHGAGRLAFDLLGPVQLVPGLQGRHRGPEGIGIDLIPPHQQQGEGMRLVFGGKLVPHGVGLGGGGEQLEVGETVAGGIANQHLIFQARQMKLPLLSPGQILGGHPIQQDLVADGAGLGLGGGRPERSPEAAFGGIRLLAGGQQLAIDSDVSRLAVRSRQKTDAVLSVGFEPQQGAHYQSRHRLSLHDFTHAA
ncbi:hypothetical protein D3C84_295630 [compost metagenome]